MFYREETAADRRHSAKNGRARSVLAACAQRRPFSAPKLTAKSSRGGAVWPRRLESSCTGFKSVSYFFFRRSAFCISCSVPGKQQQPWRGLAAPSAVHEHDIPRKCLCRIRPSEEGEEGRAGVHYTRVCALCAAHGNQSY